MAIWIFHEIESRSALLADVRKKEYAVWDCHLKYAKNDSATLSLTVGGDNPELKMLNIMVSELVVLDGEIERWRGRVTSLEWDLYGRCKIVANGVLDYLHDTLCNEQDTECSAQDALTALLENHNGRVADERKKLYLGTVSVPDTVQLKAQASSSTWEALASLVKKNGGSLVARRSEGKNYVDWLSEIDVTCERVLCVGVNIGSLTISENADNITTVLYGFGGKVSGKTVSFTVEDEDGIAAFGRIEGSFSNTQITSAAELKTAAEKELAARLDEVRSVSVKAIDEADSEQLDIGYRVRVRFDQIGLDEYMRVTELDWYPFQPTKTNAVCGASLQAISRLRR